MTHAVGVGAFLSFAFYMVHDYGLIKTNSYLVFMYTCDVSGVCTQTKLYRMPGHTLSHTGIVHR